MWFTSTESFAKVLSNRNRALLATIVTTHRISRQELAGRTGRKASDLSHTLRSAMASFGLMWGAGRVRPEVPNQSISRELRSGLSAA